MPKEQRPSICGLRVAAWGAESGNAFSLQHSIPEELYGGSTRHVAMALTIPATPENAELLLKYCSDPPIPIERHKIRVPKAIRDSK